MVNLTKSTAASFEEKFDQVLVALSQIQLGVTQHASHGPIMHSPFTEMERSIQAFESLTSQVSDLQNKLDQLPVRIQEGLAESTTPARARPSVETPGLTLKELAVLEHLTGMVVFSD